MNICNAWKLILPGILAAMLATAPRVVADDINPDADVPDIGTMSDSAPPNPVLEIPQQCDQDSVAVLCDTSADDSSPSYDANAVSASAPSGDPGDSSYVANNPNLGSVYDYANQNITNEASALGTMSVPLGIYAPGYPGLSPSPTIVSSGGVGPGFYQQWATGPGSYQQAARGPGTYRQFAPGPGYAAPMLVGSRPYGFGGGFGAHSFGGGGHFGRR